MAKKHPILSHAVLGALVALSSGCVIHERSGEAREEGYREGYYDREHSRYYHEHTWHECVANDPYCR